MSMTVVEITVVLGCFLTIAGTAAALAYDARLSDTNKAIEGIGGGYSSDADRPDLEEERNRLSTYVPFSVGLATLGVVLMGGVPLTVVVRRWLAGQLDAQSKRAAVTFSIGALMLIAGTISCPAARARLAAVSKELNRLYAEPQSDVNDWSDKFGLEWEKHQLEDRMGWFGALVGIGILLTVVPGAWAWRRIGKKKMENGESA
jgi:hypothetical protein